MGWTLPDLICDDFISRRSFLNISRWTDSLEFIKPAEQGIWKENRPHNPEIAATILWPFARKLKQQLQREPAISESLFPSRTPLDSALRAVRRMIERSRHGEQIADQSAGILASVMRYPANTGLVWHTDSRNYTGAFAIYISKSAHRNAGGTLLLRDTRDRRRPAYAVEAVPNRFVIIPPWAEHAVTLVSDRQPFVPRLAISGFFVREDRVAALMQMQVEQARARL